MNDMDPAMMRSMYDDRGGEIAKLKETIERQKLELAEAWGNTNMIKRQAETIHEYQKRNYEVLELFEDSLAHPDCILDNYPRQSLKHRIKEMIKKLRE